MKKGLFDGSVEINEPQENAETPLSVPTCKGIILFADSHSRPIQMLSAANMRRTALSRIAPRESSTISSRADISQIARRIYYCCCYNDFATSLKFNHLAPKVFPDSHKDIVKLPTRSYVKVNLSAQWPIFHTTANPSIKGNERVFGFFATRKSSQKFVEILEESFGLCRKPALIEASQKANSCPYLQMNQCPGPCVGKVTRNDYLKQIADAIDAAEGNIDKQKAKLRSTMKKCAQKMEFETAQAAKKKLEQLSILEKREYFWTGDLTKLCVLHIDKSAKTQICGKGKKVQSYAAFIIRYGVMTRLNDFILEQIDTFCQSLLNALEITHNSEDTANTAQNLAITGYFLYRHDPAGLWLDCRKLKELLNPQKIEQLIRNRFEIRTKKPS